MAKREVKLASPGTEQNVIACVYQSEDAYLTVSDELTVNEFSDTLNQALFVAIDHVYRKGGKPDPVLVSEMLPPDKRELLEKRGGWDFLGALNDVPIDSHNVLMETRKLQDLALKRRLREALLYSLDTLDDTTPGEKLLADIEETLLTTGGEAGTKVELLGGGSLDFAMERAAQPAEIPGIPTGWPILDKHLQGLQPGRAYVIAARMKVGKSLALANITKNIAVDQGRKVLFLSTEHTRNDERSRFLSLVSGVPEHRIQNGTFTLAEGEAEKVEAATTILEKAPIFFGYMPHFTLAKVRKIVKKYVRLHGVEVVVFDYIKLASDGDNQREHAELGNFAQGLKDMAGELNIPVLTAAQMNRNSAWALKQGGHDMDVDGLADSDKIARYASVVMILRKPTDKELETSPGYAKDYRILKISINRHGPSEYSQWLKLSASVLKMEETGVSLG